MADVTINELTSQAPGTDDLFPFATAGVTPSTYKASLAQIKTALAIPADQIQSDWTQANTAALDYIKNKPAMPTSAGFSAIVSLATVGTGLTWSKPAGTTNIKVTVVGAGGGGGATSFGGTNALAGGASVFDTAGINVTGNGGGAASLFTRGVGGTGANGGVNITGAAGLPGGNGGVGGPGFGQYGVGGYGLVVPSAGGAYGGGGAGGIAIKYMTVPSAATNYSYTIGAGGRGSSGGSAGSAAAGNSGIIIIEY